MRLRERPRTSAFLPPAPLPSLSVALSRRAAIFGRVEVDAAPLQVLLPTLDTALPEIDPPEPLTALDRLMLLPQAARADIVRGAL